jgi:hypothetical protein
MDKTLHIYRVPEDRTRRARLKITMLENLIILSKIPMFVAIPTGGVLDNGSTGIYFQDELLAKDEGDIPIRYNVPRDGT